MKVLTWSHDAIAFPLFFLFNKKYGHHVIFLHSNIGLTSALYNLKSTSFFKSTKAPFTDAKTQLVFKATSEAC